MAGGRRDRGQYSMEVGETDYIMMDAMYQEPQCGGGSA